MSYCWPIILPCNQYCVTMKRMCRRIVQLTRKIPNKIVRGRDFEISGTANATSSVTFRVCTLGHTHCSETVIQRQCNTRKCFWICWLLCCANMNVSVASRTLIPVRPMHFYLSVGLVSCICLCELFVYSYLRRMCIILLVAFVLKMS
jgi:hypothetical protein